MTASPAFWAWRRTSACLRSCTSAARHRKHRNVSDPSSTMSSANGRPEVKRSETLFLVDASMYVFRAWHSMPEDFVDVDGHPANAVHGFTRFLLELLERQ